MAGAYQEIPLGQDYFFTTNVSARVTSVNANLTSATYAFVIQKDPDLGTGAETILSLTDTPNSNGSVSMNTSTKIATITITDTAVNSVYNVAYWRLRATTAAGLVYTLDQGRAAFVQYSGFGAGSGVGA